MKKTVIVMIAVVLAILNLMAFAGCLGLDSYVEFVPDEMAAIGGQETTVATEPQENTPTKDDATTPSDVTPEETTTAAPTTTTTEATTTTTTVAQNAGPVITITGSSVNVRTGPGTEYDVVGRVLKGETYTVVSRASSINGVVWYKVKVNGSYGYVCSSFTSVSEGNINDAPLDSFAPATTTAMETTTSTKGTTTTTAAKTTTTAAKTTTTAASTTKTTVGKATTTTKADTNKSTTTTKATTTTTAMTTTTTKATTTTTNATSTPADSWVAGSSGDVIAELKAYAASIGLNWAPSLNASNSTWGSYTAFWTSSFESRSEYVSRVEQMLLYYKNKVSVYEYVNIYVTEKDGDNYKLTCFFG